MPLVMLSKNWPGSFGRNVRNDKGEIIASYRWSPGESLQVAPEHCGAIKADIGQALHYCEVTETGKLVAIDPNKGTFVPPQLPDQTDTPQAKSGNGAKALLGKE